MEKTPLQALNSWSDIIKLDLENPLNLTSSQLQHQGKPFRKIGFMLEEIGVLVKPLANDDL